MAAGPEKSNPLEGAGGDEGAICGPGGTEGPAGAGEAREGPAERAGIAEAVRGGTGTARHSLREGGRRQKPGL